MKNLKWLLVLVVLALTTACPLITQCVVCKSGSLKLTINVPSGAVITPQVTVTGPDQFFQTVSTSSTLSLIAPGTYTISSQAVREKNTTVDRVYQPQKNNILVLVVASNTSLVQLDYVLRPGTGKLWMPLCPGMDDSNPTDQIFGIDAQNLLKSGNIIPDVVLGLEKGACARATVIDPDGNLLTTYFSSQKAVLFTPIQQLVSGSPIPNNSSNFVPTHPLDAALNGSGKMFTSLQECGMGVGFLRVGPRVDPDFVSCDPTNGLIVGLAFFKEDLWATSPPSNTVIAFAPNQIVPPNSIGQAKITLSNNPDPAAPQALNTPTGIAFDSSNNLWISNKGSNSIVKFTPAQYAQTGSPDPDVKVVGDATGLSKPSGIAFDNSGNLWVYNAGNHTLVQFLASDLTKSGNPTPNVVLQLPGVGDQDQWFSFNPPPANLPLKQ